MTTLDSSAPDSASTNSGIEAERATTDSPSAALWPRGLIAILVLGAIVRGGLLIWMHQHGAELHITDAKSFNDIAVQLAERGEFATSPGRPTSLRPPLYPAFLAAIYRACGVENFDAVRAVQALLGLLMTVLVYRLALGLYDSRVALLAAGICCFYPSLLGYGTVLLTETMFAVFVLLASLSLQSYGKNESWLSLVLLGLFLALGALTRSVLWIFMPVLTVFLLVSINASHWTKRLASATVPLLVFAIVVAPWAIRNTRLQDTLTVIDCMGGRNVMMGNYEHTPLDRPWDAISMRGDKSWHQVLWDEVPESRHVTQGQRDKLAMRYGINFMLNNPGLTIRRSVAKFFDFWQLERSFIAGAANGWWGDLSRPALLLLAATICSSYVMTILTGVFGFCTMRPDDRRLVWFMLLVVGFVCAVHTAIFAHSRYHVSLMPLVFPFTASALLGSAVIWRKRGQTSFWVATVVSALLIGGWIIELIQADATALQNSLS